jgi:hypothetical protein
MTFAFTDSGITVTTWRRNKAGEQVWRARSKDGVAEFVADRDAPLQELLEKAQIVLAQH